MSERKSAEIKFRCTPTFKAAAQTAADASGQSLTEYIEAAVWAQHNARLDGLALVGTAIESLRERSESGAVAALEDSIGWNTLSPEFLASLTSIAELRDVVGGGEKQVEYVSTNTDPEKDAAPICACRPWEFCTHKAGA